MTITELEKEIIKSIKIESEIPLTSKEGYKDLMKFVKKLIRPAVGLKCPSCLRNPA